MLDELKTMPATLSWGGTPDAYDGEYFIYGGVVRDNLINDRWDRTALWTTDGTTDTYTIQNHGAPHSANNSFAIRCIKI